MVLWKDRMKILYAVDVDITREELYIVELAFPYRRKDILFWKHRTRTKDDIFFVKNLSLGGQWIAKCFIRAECTKFCFEKFCRFSYPVICSISEKKNYN